MATKKAFVATVFFFHKTGVVSIGTMEFPGSTREWDVKKRVADVLIRGGSPTDVVNFRTNYTNVDDVIDVLITTNKFYLHMSYDKKAPQ